VTEADLAMRPVCRVPGQVAPARSDDRMLTAHYAARGMPTGRASRFVMRWKRAPARARDPSPAPRSTPATTR